MRHYSSGFAVFAFAQLLIIPWVCPALTDVTCEATGLDGKDPSSSGYSPLVDKTFWPDDVDPLSDAAANYNFIIGRTFRTQQAYDWSLFSYSKDGVSIAKGAYDGVFKGGALTFSAQCNMKITTSKAKLTIPNLRCASGCSFNYMDGGPGYLCGNLYLDGDFSRTKPMGIFFNDNTKADTRTLCVQSTLHGDEMKHIKVYFSVKSGTVGIAYMKLLLDADNSATFAGNLIAGYNGILAVTRADAVGGNLSSFAEKAVTLCDGGALSCETAGVILPASHNRGVYVEASGGKLDAPVDWTLAYPISGPGDVEKTGAGTLTLAGAFSAGTLTVKEGALALAAGMEVPNLKFDGGSLMLVPNGSPLVVGESFVVSQPVTLALASVPVLAPGESAAYPALKVPAACAVRAGDFVITGGNGTERVRVTQEQDGSKLVTVVLNGFVSGTSVSFPSKTYFSNSEMWSDQSPINADKHYSVSGNAMFRTGTEESLYEFAGKSLSFHTLTFEQKPRVFIAKDMRVFGGTYRFTGSSAPAIEGVPSGTMALRGDIWVALDGDATWCFKPFADGMCRLEASLSGYGQIDFTGVSDATASTYRVTADNTGFVGKMSLYGNTPKDSGQKATVITFQVDDKRRLGGNPLAFCADGLSIGTNAVFQPIADVAFDDLNRGWTCGNCGCVDVPDGLSMTTKSSLAFAKGRFQKTGGGRWRVDGTAVRMADAVRFEIAEGLVEGGAARVLSEIPVALSAAGGLAQTFPDDAQDERRQYGLLMLSGVDVVDSSCCFELKLESAPTTTDETLVPLLTAPVADAELFASRAKVTLKGAPDHRIKSALSCSGSVTVGGVECKTVFACVQGKPGLVLILK